MRKMYQFTFTVFVFLLLITTTQGQNNFFTDAGQNRNFTTTGQRVLFPAKFRTSTLDVSELKAFLWSLPSEQLFISNRNGAPIITLPMPDGGTARFRVWESSIQEEGLAIKFPEIKTFAGQGIDDPYATIRFDFNPYFGFSAQILSSKSGRIIIDPYARGDVNNYMSYYMRDFGGSSQFSCGVTDENVGGRNESFAEAGPCLGTQLRTFRLAFSCTGEFAQAVGGGAAGPTHAAIVTGVNRLTQVYEDELAIRLVLIANNNLIEYLNPATDPWANDGSIAELNAITGNINTALAGVGGASAYDIGHLGCTASNAGVAGLGVVCGASKGRGLTGGLNPVGDPYYIDYVAHEMGHQFNAAHTFNSNQCASAGGSYEPGSGTTIMAYAGICAATENIQPNSDPIFHALSFDQIGTFVTTGGGSGCPAVTPTGNNLPTVTISTANNLSIPINTPFVLDATATDPDGDPITYNWEGWDVGAAGSWPSAASSTTRPLFRTRVSKTVGSRTFPDIRVIAANYPGTAAPSAMDGLRGEVLPTVARAMKFRLTVRDNRAGGGGVVSAGDGCQNTTIFQVNAVGTTPFSVTTPNGGESYPAGSTQTITWNNAGTTAAPFNVANVRITMSTDGGLTYPHVVTNSTANDGSEALTIPSVPATTTARIRIEAIGNIFFDISNANFSITIPVNGYTFGTPTNGTAACPAAGPINGSVPVNFQGSYTGPVAVAYLSGAPVGTTVNVTGGPFTANGTAVVSLSGTGALAPGTYNITVQGTGPAPGTTQTAVVAFTITPGAGPAITGQPANQTVCSGANASFTVTATGTYQWQLSTGGGPFNNIGGATTATLTLSGVTAGMSGNQYRCIVSGQCGSSTSNPATLTVNVAPAVTTNPTSQAVCSGSSVTFTAAGTGTPAPTYQWQVSTLAVPAFTNIAGATNATYTIASTVLGDNGNQYRCVLTNSCGSVNTTAATLTVNSSITVSSNPTSQTVCEGVSVSFSSSAAGSGLSYQWQVSTDGGGTFNNIVAAAPYSGTTSATMTINPVPPGFNNYRYRCVISNGVCTPGISSAATLTVNTFPAITTQPVNATICAGAANTFSVAATTGVGTLSYQWQVSTDGGTTYTNIAGATTNSFAQTNIPVGQNGYRFRVIVTAGCGSVTSTAAVLTVNAFPAISFAGSNLVNVCVSDAAFSLSASPTGTWSGAGVSGGGTFTPSVAGTGIKTLTYTASNAGCVSTATTIVNVLECAERHRRLTDYQSVIVFPVPSNGNFNIRMNSDLYTRLGVRVFGSDGKLYMTKTFTGLTYGSVVSVDGTRLAAGTYYLQIYNDEGDFTQRGVGITIYK